MRPLLAPCADSGDGKQEMTPMVQMQAMIERIKTSLTKLKPLLHIIRKCNSFASERGVCILHKRLRHVQTVNDRSRMSIAPEVVGSAFAMLQCFGGGLMSLARWH